MRLIDADALDRAFTMLRFNDDKTLKHWGDRQNWCMSGQEIEDLINSVPTIEPEPRWIPCSERLPEEKQDVLLLMPHNMVVGFWEDVLSDGGRTWYANSGDGYFTDMDVLYGYDDPIAWAPLPLAPYREEVEQNDDNGTDRTIEKA